MSKILFYVVFFNYVLIFFERNNVLFLFFLGAFNFSSRPFTKLSCCLYWLSIPKIIQLFGGFSSDFQSSSTWPSTSGIGSSEDAFEMELKNMGGEKSKTH